MQKSLEDNQATGLFTRKSFSTQNFEFFKICHWMWGTGYDGRRWNQKRTSKDRIFRKGSILDTWKKKHDHTFPTLKDVFNARNLDIPRILVKVKLFCAGCGEEGHNLYDCQNEPICVNCQGDHVAISRLPKMENWERHCDPQIYRKDFICRCSQMFTTFFRPIKGFICNCSTDPSSIFKTSSTLGQKNPTSNWL